jgi:hypothetical protein
MKYVYDAERGIRCLLSRNKGVNIGIRIVNILNLFFKRGFMALLGARSYSAGWWNNR